MTRIGIQNLPSLVAPNKDGTNPVRLITCEITEVQDLQEIELYRQAGDDSAPPIGSRILYLSIGDWKIGIACDDGVQPEALEGEKILYSNVGGQKMANIKLGIDGSIEISNAAGSVTLNPAGILEINSSVDAAALASKVDLLWNVLVTTLDSTPPGSMDGGKAIATAVATALKASPAYQNTASQKLKVDG